MKKLFALAAFGVILFLFAGCGGDGGNAVAVTPPDTVMPTDDNTPPDDNAPPDDTTPPDGGGGGVVLSLTPPEGIVSDSDGRVDEITLNRAFALSYGGGAKAGDAGGAYLLHGRRTVIYACNRAGSGVSYAHGAACYPRLNSDGDRELWFQFQVIRNSGGGSGDAADGALTHEWWEVSLPDAAPTLAMSAVYAPVFDATITSVAIAVDAHPTFVYNASGERLVFSSVTVNIADGYDYAVYSAGGAGGGRHLLRAEYAALYFHNQRFEFGETFGVPTLRENLPAGSVLYRIDHALGHYEYFPSTPPSPNLNIRRKILHGSGDLQADFAGGDFRLNLSVDDHEGNDFVEIADVQLRFSDGRRENLIYCELRRGDDCGGGTVDYADENFHDDDGEFFASFYGANGEEVAGAFYDRGPDPTESFANKVHISFIGKRGD